MGARRILVVDDCADTVEVISTLLGMMGHACVGASTGAAAIDAAKLFAPDIVLLDLVLPDISGLAVASRLREEVRHDFYMAALTGLGMAADRRRTQAAGFDEHLVKPIDVMALRRLVGRATRMMFGCN